LAVCAVYNYRPGADSEADTWLCVQLQTWCRQWGWHLAVCAGDLLSRPRALSVLSFLHTAGDTLLFILSLSLWLPCFLFRLSVLSPMSWLQEPLDSTAVLLDCFALVEVEMEAVFMLWLGFLSHWPFLISDCGDAGLWGLTVSPESFLRVVLAADTLQWLAWVLAATDAVFNCGSGDFAEHLWKFTRSDEPRLSLSALWRCCTALRLCAPLTHSAAKGNFSPKIK